MQNLHVLTKKEFVAPKRDPTSHKGQNGKVLIIGGSKEYVGSLVLAGLAALRTGCDLVTIAAPEKVAWAVNAQAPDLITHKLKGEYLTTTHYRALKELAEKADVVLIGNGIGLKPRTQRLVRKLALLPGKKVIDADGIKAIGAEGLADAIITPNARELVLFLRNSGMPALTDPRVLRAMLGKFVARRNVLLAKGPVSAVVGKSIALNKNGNAGMTRGGTGDILAGLCAGYYAQLRDPETAARNAIFINGTIGDALLRKKKGVSYLASDIVEDIKRAQATLTRPR